MSSDDRSAEPILKQTRRMFPIIPDMWWEQRQTMVRRMMDQRDYGAAYRLAVEHGKYPAARNDGLKPKFLAGWLALRFLGEPGEARNHFQSLYDDAQTPISRARGAYWLALPRLRSAER